ncbi:9-O-acetylesterase [Pedobacter chinensis]|uniref:9-O-acetylesterase n=1 Tax=Pedobacter chinensis TaxID=2282421 RepID=A0A369PXW4_9SPHI|nr:sialate O-acetylesterase [Pedobacter chinensis]RDC57344.1 9-O-acetylesterase [Pedobacter chinensis]
MKLYIKLVKGGLMVASLFLSIVTQAKVVLPALFSDYMVFQQKTTASVWGKTTPGKSVNITTTWSHKAYSTKADQDGNWIIKLQTPSFGGPYNVAISDGEVTNLMNVMIGEVWICSGQSNMEMPLAGWAKIDNYEKEIEDAQYPNIRLLQVQHVASNFPLGDAKVDNGGWKPCIPQYVANFSAVAYFFAREVYKKTGIPIGLIHTSWGGTIAEAWTSAATLKTMPDFVDVVNKIENSAKDKNGASLEQQMQSWLDVINIKDAGMQHGNATWASANTDLSSWKSISIPALWGDADLLNFDGIVWFRKTVTIPQSWEGKEVKINLGTIDDDDITYVNGKKIGKTQGYNVPRVYTIPGNKVKGGALNITVRVFDSGGEGGIYGNKNLISVSSASGEKISLDGEWKYKIGLDLKDVPPNPITNNGPNRATVLYNAMINPYLQFPIRGAIWYQGESNVDRAYQYQTLFPNMIKDWRKSWNQPDFPFYFVQLANFMKVEDQPKESSWAELREAQFKTLSLPNTGMAVAIDIGDAEDIHPKNKQEVGRRLALIALAKNYKRKITYTGPIYQSQVIDDNVIKLNFSSTKGGLKAKDGGELKGFAIAGADQKFYWAKAVIKGNQVIVSCPDVANPVAVRYAWANNPVCNLINGAGLPASPFRTDNWKGITQRP